MASYGVINRLTGGTPSVSGSAVGNANTLVTAYVPGVYWQSNASLPAWFKYDCGAGVTWMFGKVFGYFYADGYGGKDYTIALSNNNIDWTTVLTGQIPNAWANPRTYTFPNTVKYRYLRFQWTTDWDGDSKVAHYEFQAFEILPEGGGFSGGQPWIFMKDAWERHKELWKPKLILPGDLGFNY